MWYGRIDEILKGPETRRRDDGADDAFLTQELLAMQAEGALGILEFIP